MKIKVKSYIIVFYNSFDFLNINSPWHSIPTTTGDDKR